MSRPSWSAATAIATYYHDCEPEVARQAARRLRRQRLGVEPATIPGGHSPFLSRPLELAGLLGELASAATPASPGLSPPGS